MNSETAMKMILVLLENLENHIVEQNEVNGCYSMLVDFLLGEAVQSIGSGGERHKTTEYKEYWCEDLTKKWRYMKECERVYRGARKTKHGDIESKKHTFKRAQRNFDKSLKKRKQQYYEGKLLTIEACCVNNPRDFRNHIKQLGPAVNHEIPWEMEMNGIKVTDKNTVLDKWRSDFEQLYKVGNGEFNDQFKDQCMAAMCHHSTTIVDETTSNSLQGLNSDIRYDEVERAVMSGKSRKVVGIDMVANEILKVPEVIKLLHSLFRTCYGLNLIPDQWHNVNTPDSKDEGMANRSP